MYLRQRYSQHSRRFDGVRPSRKLLAVSAATALLVLGLVAAAPGLSSPAAAASSASCADSVTSAPTGPATVSAASSHFGRVLVVGSGDQAGCSLYLLTSDQLHTLSGANFACSDNANALGAPCDTVLWPALLTNGAPIAGPGVNPTLLGTATRTDLSYNGTNLGTVQQVTYAGLPLYRFIFDETPGETEGANLFDPVTSPAGTWYLVDPSRGRAATGRAQLQPETVGGKTVLAAAMDDDFSLNDSQNTSFPVYTLSTDSQRGPDKSACDGECALNWAPVLTSGPPGAGPGVDQHALGIIVRSDGSHQVTYNGKPLYQFYGDAYIKGLPYGTARIDGDGASTAWGTFHAIPLSSG
jgi:predicted lipoprotein with Yx(FWY)xxD motif